MYIEARTVSPDTRKEPSMTTQKEPTMATQQEPMMITPQPEALMLALRALDAAVTGVRTAELNEAASNELKVAELKRALSEAEATNRTLRERIVQQKQAADSLCRELRSRIADLELYVLSLRDHADTLAVELRKRETAIVDLVLKGTN